jgi:2',3'-cyclic-nucleotide 2'-phosphodiesterase/3'-nucleotidase/5'-nucleotidase
LVSVYILEVQYSKTTAPLCATRRVSMFKIWLLRALMALAGMIPTATGFAGGDVTLTPFATYQSGQFEASASEIVAHDPRSGRIFVTNASTGNLDVLQLSLTSGLTAISVINTANPVTHVRIWDDGTASYVVASSPGSVSTAPGTVSVYTSTGILQAVYSVGAFPDMLYVTSNGLVLTANEGQPAGATNPPGSVSIIDLNTGNVQTVSFTIFNGQEEALRDQGIRIFPGIPASLDLEPEYIAVAPGNTTAYAICQEQNCVVTIDIASATATGIHSLGFKDHSLPGNGLDPSDSDGGVNIANWPVRGLPMPDSSVAFDVAGQTYLLTANEGGARNEDTRTRNLNLDPLSYPNASFLQNNARLGRIFSSTIDGDTDGDGDIDQIYTYGTRSFSIFNMSENAQKVFDSGDQFATAIAQASGNQLNCNHTSNNSGDGRSDNKGCEPEAATVAQIGERLIAFIGLERQSGIMVYDVTDPANSSFLSYFTNRNFNVDIESPAAGDLGVESIVYVRPEDNVTGLPLILTGNEISGTTSAYIVSIQTPPQDCNGNNVPDREDIASGTAADCNGNGVPDSCDIASGNSSDVHGDLIPDECQGSPFVRGDSNRDGQLDISDAVQVLVFLFQGSPHACHPALDFNGDSTVDLSDVISSLDFVFTGFTPPAQPFPDCDWPAGLLGGCEASLLCP